MEPTEYFILILFIALGIFSVIAAILNLDWYFQTSGAMTFVRWLGRKGARIFYALLGLGLIACGVAGPVTIRNVTNRPKVEQNCQWSIVQTSAKSSCFLSRLACATFTVMASPNR